MGNYKTPWIWILAVSVGVLAYNCSRGQDGHLMGSFVGFGVLFCFYSILVVLQRPRSMTTFFVDLVLLELSAGAGLIVKPELDGMGGTLNILIPAMVLAAIIGGMITELSVRCLQGKGSPVRPGSCEG